MKLNSYANFAKFVSALSRGRDDRTCKNIMYVMTTLPSVTVWKYEVSNLLINMS